ncbi:MAG: methionine--tRNA ligase, partial [Alphaproteobacteria bacterium]
LTNYLTALGYPDTESSSYKRYWPAHLHVMGKDISRFHAVYWPAFLMAAGLAVPHRIFAHGFLLNAGEKMSKSVGNVIGPDELVARYGLDPLRYYLLREISFGQDGVISHEGAVQRINADLANDLGNLAQRVLTQIHRNCNARVPATGDLHSADTALLAAAGSLPERVREAFDRLAIHRALETIWEVVGAANRYVDEMAPWALRKSDPERMATVLYTLAEVLRHLAIMVQPVMPESAGRLLDQLGVAPEIRDFAALAGQRLTPGAPLPAPAPLFPRLVDEAAEDA